MAQAGQSYAQLTPKTSPRQIVLLTVLLLAVLVGWASAADRASAEYRHPSETAEFGPNGTGATNFTEVNTLAYQQSTDRLYVLDVSSGIHGFQHSAPGVFTPLGGNFPIAVTSKNRYSDLAVDDSAGSTAGDLYHTPDDPLITGYAPDGSPLATTYDGEGEICGLAVDNSGHLWGGRYRFSGEGSPGEGSVVEFTPGSGTIIKTVDTGAGAINPCKLAIDQSNNDLYVASDEGAGVWQYTAASGYTAAKRIGGLSYDGRVAVNGAKDIVYVGGGPNLEDEIRAYSTTTGSLLETIEPTGGSIQGLAVDEATDTLFVASSASNQVLEMPGVLAPKVTTDPPGNTAAVSGTVDPDGAGPITKCYFEFGPTSGGSTAYGSKQNCAQSLPINVASPVSATLPLAFETPYHYRLVVATGTGGTVSRGAERTITLHHVRGIKIEAPSQVTRTKAHLNASFEGTNEATSYYVQYGTSTAYGSRIPVAPAEEAVGPSAGTVAISVPVSGLSANTVYHFRMVAKNSQGASVSEDGTFATPWAVDSVSTEAATDIAETTATLNGSFDGATNDTPAVPLEGFHYYFEWGHDESYGNTTATPPGEDAGAHAETVHVSVPVSGLSPFNVDPLPYHYRLVVSNSTGTTYGPDVTFSTKSSGSTGEPPPVVKDPPRVTAARVEAILPTSATVAANVDPNGRQTTFVVEYGTSSGFSDVTPARSVGAQTDEVAVNASLDHLTPGTLYHYRVRANSDAGVAIGSDQTFTTSNAPVLESGEPSADSFSAHLSATVIPNGSPTEVRFQYGGETSYGSVTAPVDAGSGLTRQTVGIDLNGLQPGKTYHFRAVAVNGVGSANGSDQTFTTKSAATPPIAKGKRKSCKRGFLKRKGKCVRKHKKHKKHKRHKKHAGRR